MPEEEEEEDEGSRRMEEDEGKKREEPWRCPLLLLSFCCCRCLSSSLSLSRSRSRSRSFSLRSLALCSTSRRALSITSFLFFHSLDPSRGTKRTSLRAHEFPLPRSRTLWNLADWLAWIGMSTGLGSGDGLRSTGGGLSFSSLSSIGSSLMTGGGSGPVDESECPSPGSVELELGVEVPLLLPGLLLGPLETFGGEREWELLLLLLLVMPLLVLWARLLPLFPLG